MDEVAIVTELHKRLDELFAIEHLAQCEPDSYSWREARSVLGAAIALDTTGLAARRILIRPHVDLRVVAEAVIESAHEGFCACDTDPTFRARWEGTNHVLEFAWMRTAANRWCATRAVTTSAARNGIKHPYTNALADAVEHIAKRTP